MLSESLEIYRGRKTEGEPSEFMNTIEKIHASMAGICFVHTTKLNSHRILAS